MGRPRQYLECRAEMPCTPHLETLEESDRRFQENVAGLIKAADRIIETVDRMIEED